MKATPTPPFERKRVQKRNKRNRESGMMKRLMSSAAVSRAGPLAPMSAFTEGRTGGDGVVRSRKAFPCVQDHKNMAHCFSTSHVVGKCDKGEDPGLNKEEDY